MSVTNKIEQDRTEVRVTTLGAAQKGNMRFLEQALRQHWGLGQNIVLCWCPTETGIILLLVPHYFLGNFSESLNDCPSTDRLEALNGSFIRRLISGCRQMNEEDFYSTASRFALEPTVIDLPIPVLNDSPAIAAIEELIKCYSISYVASRAVLLFDIVDFSLFSPFEQASQLNSLSYSLNSAYNKMFKVKVNIDFARTTTGDGFYIWNRELGPMANAHLFHFMLLVVADNAIAKNKSKGKTVPVIRTGFHIGSHYEFYQAEGINPTMYSYIVGEVTIELARMLASARAGQIYIGDFATQLPTSLRDEAYLIDVDTVRFVERIKKINDLRGVEIAGEKTEAILSYLTGETGASGGESIRRFRITDKHGRSRFAYNLRINIYRSGKKPIILGMQDNKPAKRNTEYPRAYFSYDATARRFRSQGRRTSVTVETD